MAVTDSDAQRAVHAVFRIESARLIAGLTRLVRDVGLAEELGAGRAGGRARALARVGSSGQSRRVADGHGQATRDRRASTRQALATQARRHQPRDRSARRVQRARTWTPRSTTPWATICCGSCSPRVTRFCRPKRAWRSRCACSVGSRPTKLRARSWFPSQPLRSASCAPNANWQTRKCPSRCHADRSSRLRLASVLEVVYLIFNEGYSATAGRRLDAPGAVR